MAEWNGRVDDGAPFIPLFLQRIFCVPEETCLYKLCTLGMKGAFLCLASASVGYGLVVSGGEEFLQYPTQLRGAHPYPSLSRDAWQQRTFMGDTACCLRSSTKGWRSFPFSCRLPFPPLPRSEMHSWGPSSLLRSPTQKETKGRA